jgi:2-polyprenyl-6-methoxyphenol hydroxylase-like FAD-dependent oxidoreductase
MPSDGGMDGTHDVVVVGGGIAGSALATVLARAGLDVLVLERQVRYRDKVRGEVLLCWGVAELQRLGLEQVLLDAGGHYATRTVAYDEVTDPAQAEANAAPMGNFLPGVRGALDVGHPEACAALADAAAAAGATVLHGVGSVEVTPGDAPSVRYEFGGEAHQVRCRLVVGADGRKSSVRRRLGFTMRETRPRTAGTGLLVDGLYDWPSDQASLGTEGDLYYLMFPRADGRARLYLMHDVAQRGRFTGPNREAAFLEAYRFACIPGSDMFPAAKPAGPCATYPMNDTLVDEPVAPGVVLVGDAAGWNDPIIGQGLSIALRDVRLVTDILLAGDQDFTPYVEERRERMRRLRIAAAVTTDLMCTFTPEGAARRQAYNAVFRSDPLLAAPRAAPQVGPEKLPAEAFTPQNVERILALR